MGKHQRRRLREQEQQAQQDPAGTPAVTVNAGLASAQGSVSGPDSKD